MAVDVGDEVKLEERNGIIVNVTYCGAWEGRDWYWNPTDNQIMWRVPEIRECIAAPSGCQVLSADYSQIEVKLMAFLSGDPDLIKALNAKDENGNLTDIHYYNTAEIYGKELGLTYSEIVRIGKGEAEGGKKHPLFKMIKQLRSGIKTTTFGVPYGATAKRIASMVYPEEMASKDQKVRDAAELKAQGFIDRFFAKFPVLARWLEKQGDLALNYGYTSTPYGRRRNYVRPPASSEDYDAELQQIRRWAGNHPIQASNADMLKEALRRIYARLRNGILNGPKLFDARLLLVVHDEIVMMCADKDVTAVSKIMYDCMTEAYDLIIGSIIPNKIDVVADLSWEKA